MLLVPVTIGMGASSLVTNLGSVLLLIITTAVPGAIPGAVLGVVDAVFRARLSRLVRADRLGRAAAFSAVILALVTIHVLSMWGLTPSDWSDLTANIVAAAVLGAVPPAVTFVLRHLARAEKHLPGLSASARTPVHRGRKLLASAAMECPVAACGSSTDLAVGPRVHRAGVILPACSSVPQRGSCT